MVTFVKKEALLHYNLTNTKFGASVEGADKIAYKCAKLGENEIFNTFAQYH